MDVDDIATAALEIEDQSKREAFVRQACGGDASKLNRVTELIVALQLSDADGFLDGGMFAKDSLPAESPQNVPERFEIRSRHAVGGLGEVFVAWDYQLSRTVALKSIRTEWTSNPDAAARFRREAEITGYLEHPGVVPVYAFGEHDDGRPYYAMQLIQGETLQAVVTRHLDLDELSVSRKKTARLWYPQDVLRDLLNRFRDVCLTIQYAHSRQVIHRDLKPSNIMLGAYGQTLVVDWGLAKRTDNVSDLAGDVPGANFETLDVADWDQQSDAGSSVEQTRHGTTLGTPRFMSPEQAKGDVERVNEASDIYCLGATLYFILTGKAPHEGESDLESTFRKIAEGRIEVPHTVDPLIPRALSAIAMKAMRRSAKHRYQNAGDLADDVERYLADQTVSVYQSPPTERLFRLARKNPARSAAIVVATILIGIGSIAGLAVQDEMARRKLLSQRRESNAEQQIRFQAETRQKEAAAMVGAATERSHAAIRDGRYSDAATLAALAIDRMGDLESFDRLRETWLQKQDRLRRLGAFVSLVRRGEDLDYLARDTEAAILLQASLGELGVFQSESWWADLPVQDLTPSQADAIRWKVYRVLTALNSIYLKRMVIVMGGDKQGRTPSLFRLLRSFLTSNLGADEASATESLTRRIETFRPSQSAIWLGSIARFRLHHGSRIEPAELGPPNNAADGLELAIASLIASVDPAYRTWFKDYGVTFVPKREGQADADYAVDVALETLRRSLDQSPADYWIGMTTGQAYFLKAQAASRAHDLDEAIRWLDLAKIQYGRCIAIRPETAFAHADRSTVALELALTMRSKDADWTGKASRIEELFKLSLDDASRAVRIAADQDWPYWHLGAAAAFVDQPRLAIESFYQAIDLGFDVAETLDGPILKLNDLRGRTRAVEYVQQRYQILRDNEADTEHLAELAALMASLEYSRDRVDQAKGWADRAITHQPDHPRAEQILGWCAFKASEFDEAERHFRNTLAQLPDDVVATLGLARLIEEREIEPNEEVQRLYQKATTQAISRRHQSSAWFGLAKQAVRRERFDQAVEAIEQARQLDPACDVTPFAEIARAQAIVWLKQLRETDDEEAKKLYYAKIGLLKETADRVAALPNASVNEIIQANGNGSPKVLPILDGEFELPMGRYWRLRPGEDTQSGVTHLRVRPKIEVDLEKQKSVERSILRIAAPQEVGSEGNWELSQSLPAVAGQRYSLLLRCKQTAQQQRSTGVNCEVVVRSNGEECLRRSLGEVGKSWDDWQWEFQVPPRDESLAMIDVVIVIPTDRAATLCLDRIQAVRLD
ncbi:protein kinase domain-containing protein [Rhodopirellula sp. MGV]|uniref:serine/threonine-protein kinase n=1 Tax=Rhodopirellula sp. MGV TaxID=2023130 RepID=UPI001304C121|nr:serine/threonine-protein kinase [Rhodopirellula sp. MGV]